MRDKLIELLLNVDYALDTDGRKAKDSAEFIADYLLENGVIVLPCKVGDAVYVLNRANEPQKMILDEPDIRCHCSDEDNLCMALCGDKEHKICAYRFKNDNSDFGKAVFLTRDEAEQALKGGAE